MSQTDLEWVAQIEREIKTFAAKHRFAYSKNERQISAAFEIGCFHCLVNYYAEHGKVTVQNLQNGAYRYLTTPNGNPANFSFVEIKIGRRKFYLRQQVRICSAENRDIAFTPDIVILRVGRTMKGRNDKDYANGKRTFFYSDAKDVVSLFECKSMNPFPELLVSFIGMLVAAFPWASNKQLAKRRIDTKGVHLAPGLFVGGTARGMHIRMVQAMKTTYPINLFLGMHYGTWDMDPDDLNKLKLD